MTYRSDRTRFLLVLLAIVTTVATFRPVASLANADDDTAQPIETLVTDLEDAIDIDAELVTPDADDVADIEETSDATDMTATAAAIVEEEDDEAEPVVTTTVPLLEDDNLEPEVEVTDEPELLEISDEYLNVKPPREPDDGHPYYESEDGVAYYELEDLVAAAAGGAASGMSSRSFDPVSPGTVPNPPLAAACGITAMLVVDSSGSIGNDANQVKNAVTAFLTALSGTGSRVGIVDFNTSARLAVPYTMVDSASINGVFQTYLDGYRANGGTNWDDALHHVNLAGAPDLVLVLTDGRPTYSNPDGHNQPPTDGVPGNGGGDTTEPHERELAAAEADQLKSAGAHMFVVGVGNALGNPSTGDLQSIQAISGNVRFPTAGQPIGNSDYALISNFADLANAIRQLVIDLCSPSVSVRKLVKVGDGPAQPAPGWEFTADVTLLGSDPNGYEWIAPDDSATPGDPVVDATDASGVAAWQWEPFSPLDDGRITIAETLQPGYRFLGAQCWVRTVDTNDTPLSVDVDVPNATIAMNVSEGEIVTCDVTNEKLATVVVEKRTAPAGHGQSFEFTGDVSGSIRDGETLTVTDLVPGTYHSTEKVPAGWSLADISCDDNDSTGNVGSAKATFKVSAGETVKCVFTNHKDGKIVVKKDVRPNTSAATFAFTGDVSGSIGHGGSLSANVRPGTYTATETAVDGWDLASLSCDDNDSVGDVALRTATFKVAPGETVHCTFVNEQRGSIHVVKQTVPASSPGSFTFTGDVSGSIGDGGTLSETPVRPGTYTSTEVVPDGWSLTDISCDDNDSGGNLDDAKATFKVQPGEQITCTFTNTADSDLSIDKDLVEGPTLTTDGTYELAYEIVVTNSGGPGTYSLSDQLRYGAGVSVVDAAIADVDPGTVTIAEWDGTSSTEVVTDRAIAPGATHRYRVTVEASVATSIAPSARDCKIGQGEDGTGFLNTATLSVGGDDTTAKDCAPVPAPSIDVAKEIVDGPTPLANGNFEIRYEIVVGNNGQGPGQYDLADALRFGAGVTVVTASASNTVPGTVAISPIWNGLTNTTVASGVGIAPTGEHRFEVTVEASVSRSITDGAADCTLAQGENGTGYLNVATVRVDGGTKNASDCAEVTLPAITVDKAVVSGPNAAGNGNFGLVYSITVQNTGDAAGYYTLSDQLRYGGNATISTASAVNVQPGSLTVNPDWDGRTDTGLVTDQVIAAGATHLFQVTVTAAVAPGTTPEQRDCEVAQGEDGTGFLNTATVHVPGETIDASDCVPMPEADLDIVKTLVSGPTLNDDGTYDMSYEIEVSNDGDGPGQYDLSDTLRFGDGISVLAASAANTQPGTITVNTGWDGAADATIVEGQAIAADTMHVFTVTVEASVAPTTTPKAGDCKISHGEDGTGFLNTATLTFDGQITDAKDCAPAPDADLDIDKTLVSGPTLNGDGTYDLSYEIVVTNDGDGPGRYDLTDTLRFGTGISVIEASAANTQPGTITVNPDWDGATDTTLVDDQPIVGAAMHTYTITIEASVAPGTTPEQRDCEPAQGEDGTGFLNTATLRVDGENTEASDCGAVPNAGLNIAKTLVSGPTLNDDGTYDLSYEIEVSNDGEAAGEYDLADTLRFGAGISVVAATAANTQPGSITVDTDWDGQATTTLVEAQAIGPDTTHVFTVTVEASVAPTTTPKAGDCKISHGENGTGFLNTATLTFNGDDTKDSDCAPVPDADLDVDKTLVSGPTLNGDGTYDLSYEIVVTNDGDGPGTYDLDDTLRFGAGVTVNVASATNTQPGTITVNAAWNGTTDTSLVENETISGRTVHRYQVTVEASVAASITPDARDCEIDQGDNGTGFLNTATLSTGGDDTTVEDCAPVPAPSINIAKEIIDGPTSLTNGNFQIRYEIVVDNDGEGPGQYDLADTLRFGEGVTVVDAAAANTQPGSIAVNAAWNGLTETTVATGVGITPGGEHRFEVTVEAAVARTITDKASDCILRHNETGTGYLNEATVTVDGETKDATDCAEVTLPNLSIDKSVTSGPNPAGDGAFALTYSITVHNTGAAAGYYTLSDELRYGGNATVSTATATNVQPGSLTVNTDWDGETETGLVADQVIAAGATHIFNVAVTATVAPGTTPDQRDCEVAQGEDGTGFLNTAKMQVPGETIDASDCVPMPEADVDVAKTLTSGPTLNSDGNYDLVYEIDVTNDGDGPGRYDLADELRFGAGIAVVTAAAANTQPGSITVDADWDGQANTTLVTGQAIAADTTHTYTVTVEASLTPGTTPDARDCDLGQDEDGTGFLNTATLRVDGGNTKASDCGPVPNADLEVGKTLVSGPTLNADGTYDLSYEIEVTNSGEAAGEYDLADTLRFGAGVTVVAASAANTQPGSITVDADWDGQAATTLVDGEAISADTTHVFTVTVEASVAPTTTPEAGDCKISHGEDGTGFLNTATITFNGQDSDASDCGPVPGAEIGVDKTLVSGPTLNADGTYDLSYEIVVTNDGDGPGLYDLDDELRFGAGVTVIDAGASNTQPGTITVNASWDGIAETSLVADQPMAGRAVHHYTVDVTASVATTITPDARDCEVDQGEDGTGFLNTATLTVDGDDTTVDDCGAVPSPIIDITKELVEGPTPAVDGDFHLRYEIVVTNSGEGPGQYDLADTLRFGDGVTVVDAAAANTQPGSIAVNADWDGLTDTTVATGVDITPAGEHRYEITVEAAVARTITDEASDCTLDQEAGTGYLNQATVTVDGDTKDASDCAEVTLPEISVDKTVVSGPNPAGDGSFGLVYSINVSNTGGAAGYYTLRDALRYGGDASIDAATATNIQPGSLTVNPDWDGETDTGLVTDQIIAAGAVHTFQVTVTATVAPGTTPEQRDCEVVQGEDGTGFLNTATVRVPGETIDASDCVPMPEADLDIAKLLVSGPVLNDEGTYDLVYEIDVTNTGRGPGQYDLADELRFGDGISVVEAAAVNTQPGSITVDPDWDGVANTTLAEGQAIAADTMHRYTVTVEAAAAPTTTPVAGDCELGDDDGTGFLNTAMLTFNGEDTDASDCGELPEPGVDVAKNLTSVSQDGRDIVSTYEVLVTNSGDGPGTYTLTDELRFGGGIEIIDATVTNTDPGDLPVNDLWDGLTDTTVNDGQGIAARTVHRYEVTVTAELAPSIVWSDLDCELTDGEDGTGVLNTVSVTTNDDTRTDDDCVEVSREVDLAIAKEADAPSVRPGETLDYRLVVTNIGEFDALESATVSDVLPDELTAEAVYAPAGVTCEVNDDLGLVTCEIEAELLTTGATVEIRVSTQVSDDAEGDLVNIAVVDSPEDPADCDTPGKGADNCDDAVVPVEPLGTVAGVVWHDANRNGVIDAGEVRLADAEVSLVDADGVVVGTLRTDADGAYLFTRVPAGEYTVVINRDTVPANLTVATFEKDGVLDGSFSFVLAAGGAEINVDFGFAAPQPTPSTPAAPPKTPGKLPFTGLPMALILALGLVLTGSGAGLVGRAHFGASRSRRRKEA